MLFAEYALFRCTFQPQFCKPNLQYYKEILDVISLNGEECVMIGNDAHEDMIAERLGMRVFLLTDCLINKNNLDISEYRQGGFDQLNEFIDEIIKNN
jgi:FMN phosphatase YigB (HAD superfamily)